MVEFSLSPSAPLPSMSFRHEALLYQGPDDFVARLVPFLSAGVARSEPTLVVVSQPRIDALRTALNGVASSIQFMDMNDVGTNPARIIPAW